MNFGDLDETEKTDRNPRVLIRQIQEENSASGENGFPHIYITCGEEDHLFDANRQLADALKEAGAPITFAPRSGRHDFQFCDINLPEVFGWLNPQTTARS